MGLLPYGRGEPYAVDADGRPYCREHGEAADADYARQRDEYTRATRARRAAAFRVLEEEPV